MGFLDRFKGKVKPARDDESLAGRTEEALSRRLAEAYGDALASFDVHSMEGRPRRAGAADKLDLRCRGELPDVAYQVWKAVEKQLLFLAGEGVGSATISTSESAASRDDAGAALTLLSGSNHLLLDVFCFPGGDNATEWVKALGNIAETEGISVSDERRHGHWYIELSWEGLAGKQAGSGIGLAASFEERFFDGCERRIADGAGIPAYEETTLFSGAGGQLLSKGVLGYMETACDLGYTSTKIQVKQLFGEKEDRLSLSPGEKVCEIGVSLGDNVPYARAKQVGGQLRQMCEDAGFDVRESFGARIAAFTVRWMPEEFDDIRKRYTPEIRQAYEDGVPLEDILG